MFRGWQRTSGHFAEHVTTLLPNGFTILSTSLPCALIHSYLRAEFDLRDAWWVRKHEFYDLMQTQSPGIIVISSERWSDITLKHLQVCRSYHTNEIISLHRCWRRLTLPILADIDPGVVFYDCITYHSFLWRFYDCYTKQLILILMRALSVSSQSPALFKYYKGLKILKIILTW